MMLSRLSYLQKWMSDIKLTLRRACWAWLYRPSIWGTGALAESHARNESALAAWVVVRGDDRRRSFWQSDMGYLLVLMVRVGWKRLQIAFHCRSVETLIKIYNNIIINMRVNLTTRESDAYQFYDPNGSNMLQPVPSQPSAVIGKPQPYVSKWQKLA